MSQFHSSSSDAPSFVGYKSLTFLQKKITEVFNEQFGITPAFPGYKCDLCWPSTDPVNVVLFGDGAFILAQSEFWPRKFRYRLWALNKNFADGLSRISDRPGSIGHIPRHFVVSLPKTHTAFPLWDGPMEFVISSRMTKRKNVDLALNVVEELREIFPHRVGLRIYSPYQTSADIRKKLKLSPTHFALPRGDVGLDWYKDAKPKSILIHLSEDAMDDFSVVTADAEAKGWPLILPDRGPFQEVVGHHCLIPMKILLRKNVREILTFITDEKNWSFGKRRPKWIMPPILTFQDINCARLVMIRRYHDELLMMPHFQENLFQRKLVRDWESE